MQSFTVFDIVIVSITVLLGLKGLLRGFIKEVFALVGLVGGIFVASRLSSDVGAAIAPVLALENKATITLIGFILGLVGFWAITYVLGIVISKIFSMSGLGVIDRIFGFIFGSLKIFFIFSIITYGVYQIQTFKSLMNEKIGNSITFPFLVKTGGYIVKIDPSELVKKVEQQVSPENKVDVEDPDLLKQKSFTEEVTDTVKEIKKTTVQSSTAVVDTVKDTVNKKVEEVTDSIKQTAIETQNEINRTKEAAKKEVEEIKEGN